MRTASGPQRYVPGAVSALLLAVCLAAAAELGLAAWLAHRGRGRARGAARARLAREATRCERVRLAQAVHDGVVQDLAGVAFSLSAAAERLPADGPDCLRESLRDAAGVARASITVLRSLLLELCPPDADAAGPERQQPVRRPILNAMPAAEAITLEELERDPHPLLARLRRETPVAFLPALDGWLVTRRDLALQVMRDPATFTVQDERFSTGRVVGPSMLSLDGGEHARHRTPFEPPWSRLAVHERFTGLLREEAGRLVDAVAAEGRADLRRALTGPLAATAMREALGLREVHPGELLAWYAAMVHAVSEATSGRPVPPSGHAAFAALREQVAPSLAGLPGLSSDEAVSNAAVLLFGGVETADGMLANALWHLLSRPDALAEARDDRSLVAAAVEESLRLEPAAAVVDRYATRDVVLGDAGIGAGDLVSVSLAAANRDPAAFPDPDRFDLHRRGVRRHVAFAYGPHVCLGLHLARLEAVIAIETVLARLPGIELDPDCPSAPRGLVFRKPPELWVRSDPASRSVDSSSSRWSRRPAGAAAARSRPRRA